MLDGEIKINETLPVISRQWKENTSQTLIFGLKDEKENSWLREHGRTFQTKGTVCKNIPNGKGMHGI